jgi:hypothetical protein
MWYTSAETAAPIDAEQNVNIPSQDIVSPDMHTKPDA